jgi:MATE family multidrug resistance protein
MGGTSIPPDGTAFELAPYRIQNDNNNNNDDDDVGEETKHLLSVLAIDDGDGDDDHRPDGPDTASSTSCVVGRVLTELRVQSSTAMPALQSLVLSKIPWFVSLRFLGGIGGEEMAGAALATTLHNVTGMSLSVGFSFALSTLAGQAKGELVARGAAGSAGTGTRRREPSRRPNVDEDDNEEDDDLPAITPVVFLFRGMVIQLCLVVPVGLWWLRGVEGPLISLGQGLGLARSAATYLRILAPSLWAYSVQWTLTAWLQAIGLADVPARAVLVGVLLHVPLNYLFVDVLGMGYLGCGWATATFQVVQATYLISYVVRNPQRLLEATGGAAIGRTTMTFRKELHLAVSSIRGLAQYLGLAVPGLVIISEWWASETAIFLSGRLSPHGEAALAGMTIYQSINTFCFMAPMAFSISGASRVGNLLGAGLGSAAAWAGYVSVGAAAVSSGLLGLALFLLPHDVLPRLVAPDEDVVREAARTIPLLALYVFADGIQVALNGIIKGCGRQCVTVPIVVVAYWVLAVPLAYYLAFVRHDGESSCNDGEDDDGEHDRRFCGVVGLVGGMTLGTWSHMLLLALAVFGTTHWKHEAEKAKERVKEGQTG